MCHIPEASHVDGSRLSNHHPNRNQVVEGFFILYENVDLKKNQKEIDFWFQKSLFCVFLTSILDLVYLHSLAPA